MVMTMQFKNSNSFGRNRSWVTAADWSLVDQVLKCLFAKLDLCEGFFVSGLPEEADFTVVSCVSTNEI
jgi:hypothetical protein